MSAKPEAAPFDALAESYDERFTRSIIGRIQRDAVWRRFDRLFESGDRVLDLGCGTGEDAIHLAQRGVRVDGIDVSQEMIETARRRVRGAGLDEMVSLRTLAIEQLDSLPLEVYDGAVSNFGPLNCVADLAPVARALARRVRPGGRLALCLMSRFCLWETIFYPLTLQIHKSIRRWSREWAEASLEGGEELRVYYPGVGKVRRSFEPDFQLVEAPGVAVLTPPTYLEPFAQRFPRFVGALGRIDRATAGLPGLRAAADHRLIILRRMTG